MVYEDADIIVIDKPKNLVVHPAAGNWTGTLVNALIAHCGESLSGIGGERRPGIVHRLDKDTTGLMVVAKNDRAHRALGGTVRRPRPQRRAVRARLPRLRLGRTGPAARHDRPADRPPPAGARPHGSARGRARGGHPLGGARALWHRGGASRSGGEAAQGRGSRPPASSCAASKPAAPTRFGSHLASIGHPLLGDEVYGTGFRTKSGAFAAASPGCAQGPWQTGPPCPYPVGQASHER